MNTLPPYHADTNCGQIQTVLLQPNYDSILPGKTKTSTKTADRLL